MNSDILWLIPARSGSKGVKDKNVKELAGHPLLSYRIRSVLNFSSSDDVWISTDSKEYGEIAKKYGASYFFDRPDELASDTALSSDVVLHAMDIAEKEGRGYKFLGLLEPTSPLVQFANLEKAYKQLKENNQAHAIVATRDVHPSSFYVQKDTEYLDEISARINNTGVKRRQDELGEVTPSGGFYITRWDEFKKSKSFYTDKTLSFKVSELEGIEIDEPMDWKWTEFLVNEKYINMDLIVGS